MKCEIGVGWWRGTQWMLVRTRGQETLGKIQV